MTKTKIISLALLVMMLFSVFAVPVSAQDVINVDLKLDVSGGTAVGTAVTDSSSGSMVLLLAFYDGNDVLQNAVYEKIDLSAGEAEYTVSADVPSGAVTAKLFAFDSLDTLTPLSRSVFRKLDKTLKVLAIGNSFSVDGMQYLYQIAKSAGYDDIILGNLYIGSCSLDTHYNNAMYGNASYIYYKNTTGSWTETADKTMLYGIQDEDWDIITLQQASGSSGRPDTYNRLERLVGYVNSKKTNPDAKIGWHMTWAYQGNSTHADFVYYDKSQETMYNAILSAVKQEVIPTGLFDFIIPSGTAIQNARTSYIGDTLTRDGYHLSIPYGRYIAGLTWMQALTGVRAEEISYSPDVSINSSMLEIAREAANNAIKNSFVNTKSVYTEEPQINWEDYDQLELELTPYD